MFVCLCSAAFTVTVRAVDPPVPSPAGLHIPAGGSAERKAIAAGLLVSFAKTWENSYPHPLGRPRAKDFRFIFHDLKAHDAWAWVIAEPVSNDGQWHLEYLTGLLHFVGQKWVVVNWLPDGDDPADEAKVNQAHAQFFKAMKTRYSDLPQDILPKAK